MIMKTRLNLSEMYKPPPQEVLDPIKECINEINRYTPQVKVKHLVELLSQYANVPQESLILRPGSDMLINQFIFLYSHHRQIITANPTFFLIDVAAQKTGMPLLKIKLREPNFEFCYDSIVDDVKKPTLLILDNPNNPTGNLIINKKFVNLVLENENIVFLIDEAYFEFSNITYSQLIKNYSNVAILRTLSKVFGLAGSGIGYLIAGDSIRHKFQNLDIMLPHPSVTAGIHALKNDKYMRDYIREINLEKRRISECLSKLGVRPFPSSTNFLLVKTQIHNVSELLFKNDVFVHDVSHQLGAGYFRVTIGSQIENNHFLKALENQLRT